MSSSALVDSHSPIVAATLSPTMSVNRPSTSATARSFSLPLPQLLLTYEILGMCIVLITTALMDLAYLTIDRLSGKNRIGNSTESIWQYWSLPPQNAAPFNWAVPEPYRAICHAINTPILALLGALLTRRLHRTRDELDA